MSLNWAVDGSVVDNWIYVGQRNFDSGNGIFNSKIFRSTNLLGSHGSCLHLVPLLRDWHIFSCFISGRMLQASGSAILMPLLMNVMLVSFPVEKGERPWGFLG